MIYNKNTIDTIIPLFFLTIKNMKYIKLTSRKDWRDSKGEKT